jgi:hypothetical protein
MAVCASNATRAGILYVLSGNNADFNGILCQYVENFLLIIRSFFMRLEGASSFDIQPGNVYSRKKP